MSCPFSRFGCVGLSYCHHSSYSCSRKMELRLLDVLQSKQRRIEQLEMDQALRDARRLVQEASRK
jgi:hypothetical protein